jgi:hypothetical protein
MLLAYCSDTVLRIYNEVSDAVRAVEALDAEATFLRLFDEKAYPYRIAWLRPNHESRLLWTRMVGNGEYTLVVSGARQPTELLAMIRESEHVQPESCAPVVRDIERALALETGL